MEGSTRDTASTARTEWKNVAPPPPYALRDLDAHDPQLEELVDEGARDLGVLVHLPHERPDLAIRELVDAGRNNRSSSDSVVSARGMSSVFSIVTTKILSLGTAGQRRTEDSKASKIGEYGQPDAHRIRRRRVDRRAARLAGRPRSSRAPHNNSRRRRSKRRQQQPPPDRSRAAACLPHRHQLRPRRRDHLGQGRQPDRGPLAGRLRRDGRRQAAENRNLQAGQARRRTRRRDQGRRHARSAPTTTKRWKRRATTCGCSRSSSTTTTCARAPASPRGISSRDSSRRSSGRQTWSASCIRSSRRRPCG